MVNDLRLVGGCSRVDVVETVVVIGLESVVSVQFISLGLYDAHSETFVLQTIITV